VLPSLQVCAQRRDVQTALAVFDQLLKRRTTFNRFCYNCVMHLCGVMGKVGDALAVYNLMRLEVDAGSLPDHYTYSALMRAIRVSGRFDLTAQVTVLGWLRASLAWFEPIVQTCVGGGWQG